MTNLSYSIAIVYPLILDFILLSFNLSPVDTWIFAEILIGNQVYRHKELRLTYFTFTVKNIQPDRKFLDYLSEI